MLKKHVEEQMSFSDTDYLCKKLIPEDNFYRKFRQIIEPLIRDDAFADMYCKDNGRPAISPALLATATILQFYRVLSDREMENSCMYDLQIKYALGLRVDERPFDHSSLSDFRQRLLKHGKEKEVFDRILNTLVESGLITRNEIQRIDATHIIADVAIPTVITLVRKGIYEVLKTLNKRYKDTYNAVTGQIEMREYTRELVNQNDSGRLSPEHRRKKLVIVVNDAFTVLKYVKDLKKSDTILERRVDMLRRLLHEHVELDRNGDAFEKAFKDKPRDMLVTPIDEDARCGAKSPTKKFVGYKANVSEEIVNKFITNVTVMPGNRPDGETMVETIREQSAQGIIPEKVIGDTVYGDGAYRKDLKRDGITVVAPLRTMNTERVRDIFPKSMFRYDKETHMLTCPEGVTTKESWYDYQKDIRTYHFPMTVCGVCSCKELCTNAKENRRTVGISSVQEELFEAERYNATESYKADMKLRPPIEGKLSELTRYHGLRRARYRGLSKVKLQCYFTAAAVNIKRWIQILFQRLKPPLGAVVAACV